MQIQERNENIINYNIPLETTSIWSFPDRGKWSLHSSEYRGNWSPYVPYNLITRYTKEGEWVLDPFLGGGTTGIEACRLKRNFIGVDINPKVVAENKKRLSQISSKMHINIRVGDARNLDFLKNESVSLICLHPPYFDIIKYSKNIEGDLSIMGLKEFYSSIKGVAREAYRIVKKNRHVAFMIADARKKGYIEPLGAKCLQIFMNEGFKLKETIIKEQHNCKSTSKWQGRGIILLKHEYLYVFIK